MAHHIHAAADKIGNPLAPALPLVDPGLEARPERLRRQPVDDLLGPGQIAAENPQQTHRPRQLARPAVLAQRHGPGGQMQAPGVRQQLVEQQVVNGFSPDLLEIFGPRRDDQLRSRYGRKTVAGAGSAEQAAVKRLLEFGAPLEPALDHGPQQRQPAARHPALVAGGAEDRAGRLAEAAVVAVGDLVVMCGYAH